MKIVMQYWLDGGYECGAYEITKCFEYESTEAFLVDFENAIVKSRAEYDNNRNTLLAWQRKEPLKLHVNDKNFEKKKDKFEAAWNEWIKERPDCEFTTEFIFCGQQFDFLDFLEKDKIILDDLSVHELNEWFTLKAGKP